MEAINPYKVYLQVENGEKFFRKFQREIKEFAKYHGEPTAFFIGKLMSYILRFNESSRFYKSLQAAELAFNISSPYVGYLIILLTSVYTVAVYCYHFISLL